MPEYIDRGTAIAKLTALEVIEPNATMEDARSLLADMPAADVAPVVHGRWIYTGKYGEYECSVCHGIDTDCSDYYSTHVVTEQDYCPNCGAKMDGGNR